MTVAMRVRTAFALGSRNVVRALAYRAMIRVGVHPVQRLRLNPPSGPFFRMPRHVKSLPAHGQWQRSMSVFGHHAVLLVDRPPNWFADIINGHVIGGGQKEWWTIPDFGTSDIKTIWELSRMEWAIAFAQAAAAGEAGALDRLNDWLADWLTINRPGFGPNWKCGQEASIRVMHLAAAALVLGQIDDPEPTLAALVKLHLLRIAPTLSYALSQDNNHGTSEAAALFIGGVWLAKLGDPDGARFAQLGRDTLEERVDRLVSEQGTFSQYSTTYHRMMLDTLSFAEWWRRCSNAPAFSAGLIARMTMAARWLHILTNSENGDAPNVGANDGTRILRLTDEPFRDFRGSVQLATVLFSNKRAYAEPIPGDTALAWLGVPLPEEIEARPDRLIDEKAGFAVVCASNTMLLLRFPRFRFRPGQADVLHLDFWSERLNVLRDAGTYGYHCGEAAHAIFAGVAGHNTVQFDGHDQMPRLGRFLFGDWIQAGAFNVADIGDTLRIHAEYSDRWKCKHARTIDLSSDGTLAVTDRVDSFKQEAILRWRLPPGEARIEDNRIFALGVELTVTAADAVTMRIVQGWESRHYLEKVQVPVLEITASKPTEIKTLITPIL